MEPLIDQAANWSLLLSVFHAVHWKRKAFLFPDNDRGAHAWASRVLMKSADQWGRRRSLSVRVEITAKMNGIPLVFILFSCWISTIELTFLWMKPASDVHQPWQAIPVNPQPLSILKHLVIQKSTCERFISHSCTSFLFFPFFSFLFFFFCFLRGASSDGSSYCSLQCHAI